MYSFRNSAGHQLAFAYTALSALAVLLVGISIYVAACAAMRRELDRTIAGEMAVLQREYSEGGLDDLLKAVQRRAAHEGNPFRYAARDAKGHTVFGPILPPGCAGFCTLNFGGRPSRVEIEVRRDSVGVAVAVETRDLDRLRTTFFAILATGFVVLALFGIAGAFFMAEHLRRRLHGISMTAEAIMAGNFTPRVEVKEYGDEFDWAGPSINLMLERITRLIENLRQVSSDIAHDLRTPLQRMRSMIDAALRQPLSPPAAADAFRRLRDQGESMLGLFEGILKIGEIEAGTERLNFQPIDLVKLVRATIEMYAPAIQDSGRSIDISLPSEPFFVFGNRDLLMQALSNLLDNALCHTQQGTRIKVRLQRSQDDVQLVVSDNGPGVSSADRERILHRFVRLDSSRNSRGHGLGLNLVAAIASAHHGIVIVQDNDPGLRIVVSLPAGSTQVVDAPRLLS